MNAQAAYRAMLFHEIYGKRLSAVERVAVEAEIQRIGRPCCDREEALLRRYNNALHLTNGSN